MPDRWLAGAVTPHEAVGLVQSGRHVFLHGACAASQVLERALAERAVHLHDVVAYQLHKAGPEPLAAPELAGHVRIAAMFCGAGIREAVAEGRAELLTTIAHPDHRQELRQLASGRRVFSR
jgi:acyl-CoA hydrolase